MLYIRKLYWGVIAGSIVLFITACSGGDGVDGTGFGGDTLQSDDLKIIQECLALTPTEQCESADVTGDGYINFADLALMKSSSRFDVNKDGAIDLRNTEDNSDLALINACILANTDSCRDADFNNDKVVDSTDLELFESASQFDLNNDQIVDLSDLANIVVEYSDDLAILLDCLYDSPVDECEKSDLTGDQIINISDTDAFVAAARFDLNGDDIIDFTNTNTGIDPQNTINVNEDLKVIGQCMSKLTTEFVECAIADLNGDGIVNINDFLEYRSASRFDLNLDGYVDLRVTIESQDFFLLRACFNQDVIGDCAEVDFNADGMIDISDFILFRGGQRFDVNGDNIVDLYGTEDGSDIDTISSCFFQSTPICLTSDFNGDEVVNAADLAEFSTAVIFDLNHDGFVDYRIINALESQDLAFVRSCFFKAAEDECAKADFNQDKVINAGDLAQLALSSRFDLNNDSIIDLHDTTTNADLNIIKDCFLLSTDACSAADFNGDGIVNASDLGLFKSAQQYDFNGDLIVDLRS